MVCVGPTAVEVLDADVEELAGDEIVEVTGGDEDEGALDPLPTLVVIGPLSIYTPEK